MKAICTRQRFNVKAEAVSHNESEQLRRHCSLDHDRVQIEMSKTDFRARESYHQGRKPKAG